MDDLTHNKSDLYDFGAVRNNPYVRSYPPRPNHVPQNVPMEGRPNSRAILYTVSECGNVLITISGYTDYQYIILKIDNRAMVVSRKVPGTSTTIDVIPSAQSPIVFTNTSLVADEGTTETPDTNTGETSETPSTDNSSSEESDAGRSENGSDGQEPEKETENNQIQTSSEMGSSDDSSTTSGVVGSPDEETEDKSNDEV
jgi:hypothetical protein